MPKADFPCDFLDRQRRTDHEQFGLLDSVPGQIFQRRAAECFLHAAGDIHGMKIEFVLQQLVRQVRAIMRAQMDGDAFGEQGGRRLTELVLLLGQYFKQALQVDLLLPSRPR